MNKPPLIPPLDTSSLDLSQPSVQIHRRFGVSPPAHLLFTLQPGNEYLHLQPLPTTKHTPALGMALFPENAEDAALQVARDVSAFVDDMSLERFECQPKLRENQGRR